MTTNSKFHQKIVVLGGGTGQFNLLRGLVQLNEPSLITAMPGTWDSGGSSGKLRTELGVLPMGDARQCLVGLMTNERQQLWTLRESDDRFEDGVGPLKGHNFLNLEIQLLNKLAGGFDKAIDAFREKYGIKGRVIPSSLLSLHIIARTSAGKEIYGEENIDTRWQQEDFDPDDKMDRVYLSTPAEANPQALKAIKEADLIIFSSGSLFGSVLPHLLIEGVAETINKSKAKLVFVLNIMTERGQTDNFSASEHLSLFAHYLGNSKRVNYMIVNKNSIDKQLLEFYTEKGKQTPIRLDKQNCLKISPNLKIIQAPMAAYLKKSNLLRHDPIKLARTILNLTPIKSGLTNS